MSEPTNSTGINNITNFIGTSSFYVQLLIVGGIIVIALIIMLLLRKKVR
jgi:hypothetical protein